MSRERGLILPESGKVRTLSGEFRIPGKMYSSIERPTEESSFDNLKAFVQNAFERGIHFEVPKTGGQTDEHWNLALRYLSLYCFTDATLHEIGLYNDRSGNNIRQGLRILVPKLHGASPYDLQNAFPLESFNYRKPTSLTTTSCRSEVRGGRTHEILERTRAGQSPQEIRAAGITAEQIADARPAGRRNNIDVGYILEARSPEFLKELEELKNPETSKRKKNQLLNKIGYGFYHRHSKDQNPYFAKISDLAVEVGLSLFGKYGRLRMIAAEFDDAGIPNHIIERPTEGAVRRYGIVAASDRARAIEVLQRIKDSQS